jgi:hypothetical protein
VGEALVVLAVGIEEEDVERDDCSPGLREVVDDLRVQAARPRPAAQPLERLVIDGDDDDGCGRPAVAPQEEVDVEQAPLEAVEPAARGQRPSQEGDADGEGQGRGQPSPRPGSAAATGTPPRRLA